MMCAVTTTGAGFKSEELDGVKDEEAHAERGDR
jgi:hypothetical protein